MLAVGAARQYASCWSWVACCGLCRKSRYEIKKCTNLLRIKGKNNRKTDIFFYFCKSEERSNIKSRRNRQRAENNERQNKNPRKLPGKSEGNWKKKEGKSGRWLSEKGKRLTGNKGKEKGRFSGGTSREVAETPKGGSQKKDKYR